MRKENTALTVRITDLELALEELRKMVFGKKKKKDEPEDEDDPGNPFTSSTQKKPRPTESYQRPLPKESEVTAIERHPLSACAHCRSEAMVVREIITHYVEDIPLPQQKIVTKHLTEKGQCTSCGRWSTGAPLPCAPVVLGNTVRRYITYLSVICRLPYSQVQDLLEHTYNLHISQGEISKILMIEGVRLRPEYEQLMVRIREEPSLHLDETGWDLCLGDGVRRYAWTMVGGKSDEAVFRLGETRGKGNAAALLGDSTAPVVTDAYVAYDNLPNNPHQLCCAHVLRKLRDLAKSGELGEELRVHCVQAYHSFAEIYAAIERALVSESPAAFFAPLREKLHALAVASPLDPAKLVRIRNHLRERPEQYLTCLLHPGVAADNNAAERSLRHLVLKRKISFGSFSKDTAETLAVLLSVLLSSRRRGQMREYLVGV